MTMMVHVSNLVTYALTTGWRQLLDGWMKLWNYLDEVHKSKQETSYHYLKT